MVDHARTAAASLPDQYKAVDLRASREAEQAREIQEAFRAMDLDGNHEVDFDEFYEVGKLVHGAGDDSWSVELCEQVFSMLDTNGDHRIGEAEFTAYLQQASKEMCDTEFAVMIESYVQMGQKARLQAAQATHEASTRAAAAAAKRAEKQRQIEEAFRALDLDKSDPRAKITALSVVGNHRIDFAGFYNVGKLVHLVEGGTADGQSLLPLPPLHLPE